MQNRILYAIVYEFKLKKHLAIAVSTDGIILAQEEAKDKKEADYALGVTSQKNHAAYKKHFPNGYTLEWVSVPSISEVFIAAMNKAAERRATLM